MADQAAAAPLAPEALPQQVKVMPVDLAKVVQVMAAVAVALAQQDHKLVQVVKAVTVEPA
jgi:hypothetical protein